LDERQFRLQLGGIEMAIKLITDNKWKHFKYGNEVPKKVMETQFDYLSEEKQFDYFIQYRKRWYHIDDFLVISKHSPLKELKGEWHGYMPDSFFSGIVIQISDDNESYIIGTYIS
jgi:hypothetical protein